MVAGGDETQFSGPAHGQVVHGEIGGIAEMRVPAFARADEKYVVAGVVDDVAAVTEAQEKIGARQGWFGKHDEEIIVAAQRCARVGSGPDSGRIREDGRRRR